MQQLRAASAGSRDPRHSAPPSRPPYSLSIGLPSRDGALQAQKANMLRFQREQTSAYAALPYLPWTDTRVKFGVPTGLCASHLPGCHGLRGVELLRAVRTDHTEAPLMYYPGLLVTERMYLEFYAKYHCPTGLEVPALNYRDEHGEEIKMLIVGDPTAHGAIINDGKHSGREVNCKLSSVKMSLLPQVLRDGKNGKKRVNAQVATVYALPEQHLKAGTELLIDYGAKFWEDASADEYCIFCFRKEAALVDDPLILCDGRSLDGTACPYGRHRLCFPKDLTPSLSDVRDASIHFYCPDHAAQGRFSPGAATPGPRMPRKVRMDMCTPPPTFSERVHVAEPVASVLPVEDSVFQDLFKAMRRTAGAEVRMQPTLSERRPDLPVQLGLFVTQRFSAGQLVVYYGGILRDKTVFKDAAPEEKTHVRALRDAGLVCDGRPLADMFFRPIPAEVAGGLGALMGRGAAALLPSAERFSSADLHRLNASGLGFMANTDRLYEDGPILAPSNVKIAWERVRVGDQWMQVPFLQAIRDIAAGQEIISPYGKPLSRDPCRARSPTRASMSPASAAVSTSSGPAFVPLSPPPVAAPSAQRSLCFDQHQVPDAPTTPARALCTADVCTPLLFTTPPALAEAEDLRFSASSVVRAISFSSAARPLPRATAMQRPRAVCAVPSEDDSEEMPAEAELRGSGNSDSENDWAPSPAAEQPSEDAGSSDDFQAASDIRAGRALRTAAPPQSAAASLSAASQVEEQCSIVDLRGATSAKTRIRIRRSDKAKEQPEYGVNNFTMNRGQIDALQSILSGYTSRGCPPWFIPKSSKSRKDEVVGAADVSTRLLSLRPVGKILASSASAASAVPSLLRAPSVTAASICEAAAPAAPSGSKTKRDTTDRWRNVDSIAHDWADYKSCCGGSVDASMARDSTHSSRTIATMFAARLKFFAEAASRQAFSDLVRYTLSGMLAIVVHGKTVDTVSWQGGRICLSCLRAVMGKGRGWFFQISKAPDAELRAQHPEMTSSGNLRKARASPGRDRVYNLLRQYCVKVGHHMPNVKGKDLDKIRYYMPITTMPLLAAALSEFELTQRGALGAKMVVVSLHQLWSARQRLAQREKIHLTLGSSVSLMRCATCDKLENRLKGEFVALNNRTAQQQMEDRLNKQKHLAAMQLQRDFFNKEKQNAMDKPTEQWTITLDGMDQAKTQLPHRARFSKDLEPLPRLKVHVEGGFCFGGPRPIIGLINFGDLRKDSNLCVTAVERILDIQWQELEKHYKVEQEHERRAEEQREAAAQQDADLRQARQNAAEAAPSVGSSPPYPANGLASKWPRRLHVTFDNAAGECKNQWMFRFLGLLVLHGVFQYITVSTMLVGHTHDIVDQLFSVWARLLRISDAETYEKMRKLFHERYISRIEGLVQLMKKRREKQAAVSAAAGGASAADDAASSAGAASAAPDGMTPAEVKIVQELQLQEQDPLAAEWQSQAGQILENFTHFVKDTFTDSELSPQIELQEVSVEVQGWLERAVAGGPLRVRKSLALPNITEPHHFGIEMDKDSGDVYLYNRYLANSTEVLNDGVNHQYRGKATGDWTTRAKLYSKGDGMDADPYRIPPIGIDTASLRKTVRVFAQHSAMTQTDADNFDALLTRLDDAQAKQVAVCSTCAELAAAYSGFGTIHRAKNASEGEKKEANKKNSSKDTAWNQMRAHLYDPQFADVHNAGMVHTNFWRKWLARARDHILPSFVLRGFVVNPATANLPYHAHPRKLVSNGNELPCMDAPERADVSWLMQNGVPRIGQMAVIRGDMVKEPVWVGIIRGVEGLTSEAQVELRDAQLEEATCKQKEAQDTTPAPAAAAAAAAPARKVASNWRIPLKNASLTLKQFRITVEFWDLHPTCFSHTLHLCAAGDRKKVQQESAKWWKQLLAKHHMEQADLDRLQDKLNATGEAQPDDPPPPALAWIVDLYKQVSFIPPEREGKEFTTIKGSSLVVWGPRGSLFGAGRKWAQRADQCQGKGWKLRTKTWKPVREDLTEQFLDPDAAENEDMQELHGPGQQSAQVPEKDARPEKNKKKKKTKKKQSHWDEESSASDEASASGNDESDVAGAAVHGSGQSAKAPRKTAPGQTKAKAKIFKQLSESDEGSSADEEESEAWSAQYDRDDAMDEEKEEEEEAAPPARGKVARPADPTKTAAAQAQRFRAGTTSAVQSQASPKRKRAAASADDEPLPPSAQRRAEGRASTSKSIKRLRVSAASASAVQLPKVSPKRGRQAEEEEEGEEEEELEDTALAEAEHEADGAPPPALARGSGRRGAPSTRLALAKRVRTHAASHAHASAAATPKPKGKGKHLGTVMG